MNTINTRNLAPVVLRIGLSAIFIWFGCNQLINQEMWAGLIPKSIVSLTGLSDLNLVTLNGLFEIVMAVLLVFGIKIRIVALILSLHLLTIVFDLGLNTIGVRDVGLTLAMLSVALHGADAYSYDKEEQLVNL